MKFLFYLGHPAHFHLFKCTINTLRDLGHDIKIVIKKKDVLEELLVGSGFEYENILPKGRRNNTFSIATSLLYRDYKLLCIARDFQPDLMAGTSAEITHVGALMRIPSIVVNEDDADVVPLFAKVAYPLASYVLAPSSCRMGRWRYKQIAYSGYHELAYLHPNNFRPDRSVVVDHLGDVKRYFILRFAELSAHHDVGKSGIETEVAENIIKLLEPYGRILITAERELEPKFEKYRMRINPSLMHHFMYYADLYVGDSQTMAAEAAVLGTPSLRFNDFVGKIGYLEELEQKYQLTYGVRTDQETMLHKKIKELMNHSDSKVIWQDRRAKMLSENVDLAFFMTWLFEKYPASAVRLSSEPDFQLEFAGTNQKVSAVESTAEMVKQ